MSLAQQTEFQRFAKKTRREAFLEEMDATMPWAELLALVQPHYSKGEAGRKPVGLEIMLRVYFLQQRFALSDPAAEDSPYESAPMRRFAGIDLPHGRRPVRRGGRPWRVGLHQSPPPLHRPATECDKLTLSVNRY
jgi:hypothetical protein